MKKSKCCGGIATKLDDCILENFNVIDGYNYICVSCRKYCKEIPNDILSQKEIIEQCNERMAYLDRLRELDVYKNDFDYKLLKSMKYHIEDL